MGDALDFLFGGEQELAGITLGGGALPGKKDEVDYGFEGIVDLMGDGGGHASGSGNFFGLDEEALHALAVRDVAGDLGGSDDATGLVFYGGDGGGDFDFFPGFGDAGGFIMLEALAGAEFGEDLVLLVLKVCGDEAENGLADDFFGGVAEHALRAVVPGADDAVEVLADDGVVGGIDDGGEAEADFVDTFAFGDVVGDLGGSDDAALVVLDGGDGDRDGEFFAVLAEAHGLEVLDALAGAKLAQEILFLVMQLGRDDDEDRLAQHLLSLIAEDAGGGFVPT